MIRARFVQLLAVGEELHALDERGDVWRYRPHNPCYWQRLDGDDDRRDFDRKVKGGRA